MNVLIVEDEVLIQKSLKLLIEKRGHTVDATSSGRDAIDKIHGNNYDRIVCDLMLQDISGFDIIEESKKSFSLEDIKRKFIIITAYSSPQVLEKARAYQCSVLSKPFQDIKTAIDLMLEN